MKKCQNREYLERESNKYKEKRGIMGCGEAIAVRDNA